jgi:hypothetical protein
MNVDREKIVHLKEDEPTVHVQKGRRSSSNFDATGVLLNQGNNLITISSPDESNGNENVQLRNVCAYGNEWPS